MKSILSFLALSFCLFLSSCGSSAIAKCNSLGFAQEFQEEFTIISATSQAYSSDPTPENCEAFKDAYRSYIDVLASWEDCAIELNQEADWRESLEEARQDVEDIEC